MFDINTLPQLIRRDIEHGESNFPPRCPTRFKRKPDI